jgi:cytoskeletal protein CcmA (bactofilin family)
VSEGLNTFLDTGTSFEGRIMIKGVVRIDGHFRGDGRAEGTLIIGEAGVVEADLEVGKLVVQGSFTGTVVAIDRIQIGARGRVEGVLKTPVLEVEDGAQLTASVDMK